MTDNEQDAREKQTYASFGGRKPQLLGDEQAALIASQARRIEELEEGLEPFAAIGECVLAEAPQSASRLAVLSGCDGGTLSLEFSDLRAAISLLSRKGGE
jgi:hypothetical protein